MNTKHRLLAALSVLAVSGFASAALADWHADCRSRIERREAALDRAVARSGAHSGRAEHERRALDEARDWCWRDHHVWWDGHAHIWATTHW